jgi:hypothetical protein
MTEVDSMQRLRGALWDETQGSSLEVSYRNCARTISRKTRVGGIHWSSRS